MIIIGHNKIPVICWPQEPELPRFSRRTMGEVTTACRLTILYFLIINKNHLEPSLDPVSTWSYDHFSPSFLLSESDLYQLLSLPHPPNPPPTLPFSYNFLFQEDHRPSDHQFQMLLYTSHCMSPLWWLWSCFLLYYTTAITTTQELPTLTLLGPRDTTLCILLIGAQHSTQKWYLPGSWEAGVIVTTSKYDLMSPVWW